MAKLPNHSTSLLKALNNVELGEDKDLSQLGQDHLHMDDLENDPHYLEELAEQGKQRTKKIFLGVLSVGLLGLCVACAWLWYSSQQESNAVTAQPTTPISVPEKHDVVPVGTTSPATPSSTATPSTAPVVATVEKPVDAAPVAPASVKPISTPIPKDPALAAEELDRITDENKRLQEEAALLEKQVKQTEDLIALKTKLLKQKQELAPSHP